MAEQHLPFGPEIEPPLLVDPILFPVLEHAQEMQSKLDAYPNAPLEVREDICAELNESWPRMDFSVLVSGKLVAPEITEEDAHEYSGGVVIIDVDDEDALSPIVTINADGEHCTSRGFRIVEEGRINYGDEDLGARYAIKLLFIREVTLELPGHEEPVSLPAECVGDIDETIMTFGDMSDAMAEYSARDYFEDYTNWVDAQLDDCSNIAEGILALKNQDIRYEHFITDEEQLALQIHLQEILGIGYDGEAFDVMFSDSAVLFEAGDPVQPLERPELNIRKNELVKLLGIEVHPKVEVELVETGGRLRQLKSLFELRLQFRIVGRRPHEDSEAMSIRVDNIENMRSIRDAYHDAYNRLYEPDEEEVDQSDELS